MSNALGCLLKLAGQVVPEVEFEYRILEGHTTNEIGNQVAMYGAWTKARGNIQPGLVHSFNARGVSDAGAIMKALGFDQSKRVVSVFAYGLTLNNIHDQDMPDQIRYHGLIYNIWSVSDWFDYDGWKSLVCIEDTREREPVMYTVKIEPQLGGQIIINPMSKPFLFTEDIGVKGDSIQFASPYLLAYKKSSGWKATTDGVTWFILDREVQPHEAVLYNAKSSFTLTWGSDE